MNRKILITITLVVIGGIFYYQNRVLQKSFSTATSTVQNNELQTPVQNVGWKSYSNSEFGFSFEYPPTTPDVVEEKLEWQPGIFFRTNPVDDTYFFIHVLPVSEYKNWDEARYNNLITFNSNPSGYQFPTKSVDLHFEGEQFSNDLWQKTVISGMPALDLMRCGGGDVCRRTVYILKGDFVFEITELKDYFKKEPQVINGFSYEFPVSPNQRIEETTDFDRILSSFEFKEQ